MATTQTVVGEVAWTDGESIFAVDLTTMEPGVGVNVSYASAGASGADVFRVSHEVIVRPTSRDPVEICHIRASDSASGSTAYIVPDTLPAGDLAGATVRVYLHFLARASGGIS
jgi:hypothetical protein